MLPARYDGLRVLQREFDQYQNAAFGARPPRFYALELAGETGELANLEKKEWRDAPVPQDRFRDEAADVCIALLNYSNARGVDLASAVRRKMAVIEERRRAGEMR